MNYRKAQIRVKIILDLQDTLNRMRGQYKTADFYTKQLLEIDGRKLKRQLDAHLGLYKKELKQNGIHDDFIETLL